MKEHGNETCGRIIPIKRKVTENNQNKEKKSQKTLYHLTDKPPLDQKSRIRKDTSKKEEVCFILLSHSDHHFLVTCYYSYMFVSGKLKIYFC